MSDADTIAKVAYDAHTGESIAVAWESLTLHEKACWRAAALAAGKAFLSRAVQQSGDMINVSSVYGNATRKPYVQVSWGESLAQLSPDTARQLGRDLLDAASAAETDAFLVEFTRRRIGVDERRTAILLEEFRKWRKEMTI